MKSKWTIGSVVIALVVSAGTVGILAGGADNFDARRDFDSRVLRGFKIAPVKLNFGGSIRPSWGWAATSSMHSGDLSGRRRRLRSVHVQKPDSTCERAARQPHTGSVPRNDAQGNGLEEPPPADFPAPAGDAMAGVREDEHARADGDS